MDHRVDLLIKKGKYNRKILGKNWKEWLLTFRQVWNGFHFKSKLFLKENLILIMCVIQGVLKWHWLIFILKNYLCSSLQYNFLCQSSIQSNKLTHWYCRVALLTKSMYDYWLLWIFPFLWKENKHIRVSNRWLWLDYFCGLTKRKICPEIKILKNLALTSKKLIWV